MSLTYPAAEADKYAQAYLESILDLVGDREPLGIQEELVGVLLEATDGLEESQLDRPERPGKWSIAHVVQHLADMEIVFGFRYRQTLAGDRPTLPGIDQDRWAELHPGKVHLADALDQLRATRQANLRLLRSLTPDQLNREAIHAERGAEPLRQMIRLVAGHDIAHRNQIDRIKSGIGA